MIVVNHSGTCEIVGEAHMKDAVNKVATNIVSDGDAGTVYTTVAYTRDYTRTRLGKNDKGAGGQRQVNGLMDVRIKTSKSNGIPGLYRGIGTSGASASIYKGRHFGLPDTWKPVLPGEHADTDTLGRVKSWAKEPRRQADPIIEIAPAGAKADPTTNRIVGCGEAPEENSLPFIMGKSRKDLKDRAMENLMPMNEAALHLTLGRVSDTLATGSKGEQTGVWRIAHTQGITSLQLSRDNSQPLSASLGTVGERI